MGISTSELVREGIVLRLALAAAARAQDDADLAALMPAMLDELRRRG